MDRPTLARRGCALLTALLIGALYAQALAADFQTGWQAYESGDYATALREFRPLAEQGIAEAQYNLGLMYAAGEGVPKDDAEAVKWFRKAAEQGVALAQHNVGAMYANGRGVPKDDVEAVKWFRKAAEQGFVESQLTMGFMYANGKGVPKDSVEAVRWYRMAAAQGHVEAQFNLGLRYAFGRGVLEDSVEGYAWLSIAFAQDAELEKETLTLSDGLSSTVSSVRRNLVFKMSREQVAAAKKLAREYWEKYVLPFRE